MFHYFGYHPGSCRFRISWDTFYSNPNCVSSILHLYLVRTFLKFSFVLFTWDLSFLNVKKFRTSRWSLSPRNRLRLSLPTKIKWPLNREGQQEAIVRRFSYELSRLMYYFRRRFGFELIWDFKQIFGISGVIYNPILPANSFHLTPASHLQTSKFLPN